MKGVDEMKNQQILLDGILNEYYEESSFRDIDRAFESFATEQIYKYRDLGIDEINSGLVGDSRDGGADGIYIFLDDELILDIEQIGEKKIHNNSILELNILQHKNTNKVEELVLDRFLGSVDFIYDLSISRDALESVFSEEIIDKIILFHECWKKTASKHPKIKVKYSHVCKGNKLKTLGPDLINESYITKRNLLIEKVKRVSQTISDIQYEIYDANDLLNLYRKKQDYSLEIKLNENPIGIEYQVPGTDTKQGGYIASVNIRDYNSFIKDGDGLIRKYLFESNIRDYQNNTEVNKAMQNSLENEKGYDFWWLNNGVTIIADKGTLSGKSLHLDNVQIVNGLQTSHNIFMNEFDDEEKRSLLLKIVVTDDKETKDAIIKSTNSQNYVHPSLFKATDPIQRNIEDYLLKEDYYYDRRKNFYKNQGKPINSIISINFMAQCITTIVEKNPSKARQSPASLTKQDKTYDNIFSDSRDLKVYLNSVKLVKMVEKYFKEQFNTTDDIENNILNNFKFHVARVLMSILCTKHRYNDNEVKNVKFEEIDASKLNEAIELLKEIIIKFREENTNQNIINIAKNSSFSEYITTYLKEN
ncbi:hypothetical protein FDG09_03135 [Clostridium sporogenes]|nr:hypothetical protein [Clostridium sporogenes]